MEELFSPPGTEWRPVSPRLKTLRWLSVATLGLVAGVGLAVPLLVLGAPLPLALAPVALLALVVLLAGWLLARSVSWWGYAEREDDLYIRRGALVRRLVVVPYGRMQYVDVQAGPLDQLFGIAKVHLHTASPGTSAVILGLSAAEAARLRDKLTARGEAQAAGL